MTEILIPTWSECDDLVELFERTDRTIESVIRRGSELTPLQNMVYKYDDANPDRSKEFLGDLKKLVEWCVNERYQVIANHEAPHPTD